MRAPVRHEAEHAGAPDDPQAYTAHGGSGGRAQVRALAGQPTGGRQADGCAAGRAVVV